MCAQSQLAAFVRASETRFMWVEFTLEDIIKVSAWFWRIPFLSSSCDIGVAQSLLRVARHSLCRGIALFLTWGVALCVVLCVGVECR